MGRPRSSTQSTASMVRTLQKVERKGRMNANLKKAVSELIKALRSNDLELAYELSSVKSFVTGSMHPTTRSGKPLTHYHFREDADYNKGVLSGDIYGILDDIHHELAFAVQKIPSGLAVVTARGYAEKPSPTRRHPTITLMERERAEIRKRARRGL